MNTFNGTFSQSEKDLLNSLGDGLTFWNDPNDVVYKAKDSINPSARYEGLTVSSLYRRIEINLKYRK